MIDVTGQIEQILAQINNDLAPQDRVCEHEIGRVGGELNRMLNAAMAQASCQMPPPAPPQILTGKLAALWAALKDRISAWLAPVTPWWVRFVNALKEKLHNLINGNEIWVWTGLAALAIALVAALVKSMTLLIGLLAIVGFARLLKEILPARWAA
jgi:hypothetical protein